MVTSGHQIHAMDTDGVEWEVGQITPFVVGETGADHNDTEFQSPVDVLPPSESLELMASCGSTLFCCGRRSTNIYAVDAFSLKVFNHFGIAACVRNELTGEREVLVAYFDR